MSLESDVGRTIDAAVKALAAERVVPLAVQNRPFNENQLDGSGDQIKAYFRLLVLPVPPDVRGVTSGWSVYDWLMQIDVRVQDGLGESRAKGHVDAIRAAFPYAHIFGGAAHRLQVMAPSAVAPSLTVDGWLTTPTTTRVRAIV